MTPADEAMAALRVAIEWAADDIRLIGPDADGDFSRMVPIKHIRALASASAVLARMEASEMVTEPLRDLWFKHQFVKTDNGLACPECHQYPHSGICAVYLALVTDEMHTLSQGDGQ